jgi:hypothetical protein
VAKTQIVIFFIVTLCSLDSQECITSIIRKDTVNLKVFNRLEMWSPKWGARDLPGDRGGTGKNKTRRPSAYIMHKN